MDLLNNLVFTALNVVRRVPPLTQKFFPLPTALAKLPQPVNRDGQYWSYNIDIIEEFCAIDDPEFIEDAIQKHWADLVAPTRENYILNNNNNVVTAFNDQKNRFVPPYHLIYAYLVENTRAAQIFEKLVYLYLHDEKLNKATTPDRIAFQWILNTENLFFKHLSNSSYRNISSSLRPSVDASRRNAYFRLLGMDLAFGDSASNAPVAYYKAEFNNQPFIALFEKFLIEVWQAYTNARNQVGANTTDMISIVDTAKKMQEMLMSRRTTDEDFTNYRYFNLSREEYASVVMMSWFYEVISYDSPLVQFLKCNGNTPGERLINIGKKVGIPPHSKSEGLLDIAPPMNTLLRRIEIGEYSEEPQVNSIIRSQVNNLPANDPDRVALNDILSIVNNWEKATGHRIKNPDVPIITTVRAAPPRPATAALSN